MKIKFLLPFMAMLFIVACKKDSDDEVKPADVYVKASIDGKKFSVGAVPGPNSTTGSTAVFSKSQNKLFIYGTGKDTFLVVTVTNFPKKNGTFALGDVNFDNAGNYTDATDDNNSISYFTQQGRTGTVTISSFDGKIIAGTFSFNAYSITYKKEAKITNGEFNVLYREI